MIKKKWAVILAKPLSPYTNLSNRNKIAKFPIDQGYDNPCNSKREAISLANWCNIHNAYWFCDIKEMK